MVIAKADGADEQVEKYLKDAVATDVVKQSLGKKQLAYPIKKLTEAEYFLWTFEAPGSSILPLDTKLRLEQDLVLRHLLTTFDPKKVTKVSKAASIPEVKEEPEVKARPKVTVTTKIVASTKSQSGKEPEESKSILQSKTSPAKGESEEPKESKTDIAKSKGKGESEAKSKKGKK